MFPVLIELGPIQIPTYGVLVALAYLSGILWLKTQIKHMGLTEDRFWFLIYSLFFGAIAGGKLLFWAVEYRAILDGDLRLVADFRYGFVFFGGFLGSCLAGLWARRRMGFAYLKLSDYFAVALPMGHALGRLGCLAAGCCFGRPTSLPWGVHLGGHPLSSTPDRFWGVSLHPTQVYESIGNAVIALVLWSWLLPKVKRGRLVPGTMFLGYIISYSVLRFVVEVFRGDDRGFLAGLSVSQWIALAAVAAAAWAMRRNGVFRRVRA